MQDNDTLEAQVNAIIPKVGQALSGYQRLPVVVALCTLVGKAGADMYAKAGKKNEFMEFVTRLISDGYDDFAGDHLNG